MVELTGSPGFGGNVYWDGHFYVGMEDGLLRSADAEDWTSIGELVGTLVPGASRLLVVADDGTVWSTSDGSGWTRTEQAFPAPAGHFAVPVDVTGWRDGFVAVGAVVDSEGPCSPMCPWLPALWLSQDGLGWGLVVPDLGNEYEVLYAVAAAPDGLLLVSGEPEAQPMRLWQSGDGLEWTPLEPRLYAQEGLLTDDLVVGARTFAHARRETDDSAFHELWELAEGRWIDRTPASVSARRSDGTHVFLGPVAAVPGGYLLTGYAYEFDDEGNFSPFTPVLCVSPDAVMWTEIELPASTALWQVASSDERIVISGVARGATPEEDRQVMWVTHP